MPSPFPGMDPYLEDPYIFPDLHGSLLTLLQEQLNHKLPDPYYARIQCRTWYEVSDPEHEWTRFVATAGGADAPIRGIACRAATTRSPGGPIVIRAPLEERREPYLQICRGRLPDRALITHIEVLTPADKTPGAKGRRIYRKQCRDVVARQAHLVEIDLLRSGRHTTAVPFRRFMARIPRLDYHVSVRRNDFREQYHVYPICLDESLPQLMIPLGGAARDVWVDLQAVFNRAYDAGPYRKEIDYAHESPNPPLDEKRMDWARERIAAWKANPAT